MTTIKAYGHLLTASVDDRTLTYRLLPYGEEGRTNVGKVTASAGHLTIPDASTLVANLEHDPTRPLARFVSVEEDDDGLTASLRVLGTSAGNDLLIEAAEGVRTGISVEISDPVIRAGELLGGTLTGAGFVTSPAFPSAQLAAADAGELPEGIYPDSEYSSTSEEVIEVDGVKYKRVSTNVSKTETTPINQGDQPEEGDQPDNQEEQTMGAKTATVPAGSLAASRSNTNQPAKVTKGDLFAMLAGAHRQGGTNAMLAALSNIVPANTVGMEQPQYVGELWDGKAYERRIIPLFNHADLTSFEVKGWRWVTKPVVAPYAGNKGPVPSAAVSTEQLTISAERIAGAHDIDRKYRDFNDEGFFAAYFAAMTESYAKVSDAQVLADVITAAGVAIAGGAVPAGVSLGMTMIVDGALAVLNDTDTMPSFAVVASGLWRDIVLTREQDKLAFLNAALGLEDGSLTSFRVVPSAALTAGQVLVGARDSVTVHELGGTAPIRVEAQDIANGGIDEGVFGYYAVNVHDADGLVLVDDGIA